MTIATIAVWTCVFVVAYVYFGYPLLVSTGLLGGKKPVRRGTPLPTVSIIIPAHNERQSIGKKIESIATFTYPQERIEILVGSDGSTDGTAEVVRSYPNVVLYESTQQRGKSSIQNELVLRSSGDILVFTDADRKSVV
jgi:cellulose synthase/poly-beta-1,6-N-acetylglucosamine synthase-like glycosyltransferase